MRKLRMKTPTRTTTKTDLSMWRSSIWEGRHFPSAPYFTVSVDGASGKRNRRLACSVSAAASPRSVSISGGTPTRVAHWTVPPDWWSSQHCWDVLRHDVERTSSYRVGMHIYRHGGSEPSQTRCRTGMLTAWCKTHAALHICEGLCHAPSGACWGCVGLAAQGREHPWKCRTQRCGSGPRRWGTRLACRVRRAQPDGACVRQERVFETRVGI